MPTYTLKSISTGEEHDIICSYNDLKKIIEADTDLEKVLSTAKFVGNTATHANSNTSDGWKDLLGRIKKGSGRSNTIKT